MLHFGRGRNPKATADPRPAGVGFEEAGEKVRYAFGSIFDNA
jgi:hypothetical protein